MKRGKKPRIDVKKMIELYELCDGKHAQIARKLGCTREYVRQVLSPLGLKATYGNLDKLETGSAA